MRREERENAIVDWLRLFSKDIEKLDDLLHSSSLIDISYSIFGEQNPFEGDSLISSIFDVLCDSLRARIDLPIHFEKNEIITQNALLEYCEVLYVYSLSCNDRSKFASLILSQPCYLQASLKELFEDVTCRKDDDTTTQPIENNSNLLESLLQAQEDIERLNKVKASLELQLVQAQKNTEDQLNQVRSQVVASEKENDILREQLRVSNENCHSLEQQANRSASLQEECERQSLQIKQLSEELAVCKDYEDKVEKLESLVEKYKDRMEVMQQSNETIQLLQKEVDRLRESESELVKKNMEVKDLQTKLNVSSQGVQMLSGQITELQKENERLKTQIYQNQQDMNQLRKQNDYLSPHSGIKRGYNEISEGDLGFVQPNPQQESKCKRLEEENELMRVQIEEYEKREKESSLESEVLILRQRCCDMETELKEQVHENELLLEEKEKMNIVLMDTEKKLEEEIEETMIYQNSCNQLMEEKEQLQNSYNNQIQKLENEIDELLCEISDMEQEALVDNATAYSICQEVNNRYKNEMKRIESMKEEMKQQVSELENKLKKQNAIITEGKGQLEHLRTTCQSLEITLHSKKAELELLTNKNAQQSRELFLLRRSKADLVTTPTSVTHSDEYALLLKTNEELTNKVKELEEKQQSRTVLQLSDSDNMHQVAKSIDLRIKELENENRSLTMNKSQLLQNKHILEQQIDEVVKESNKTKSENTRLKLHLQRIKRLAQEKQYKELQVAIESISIR